MGKTVKEAFGKLKAIEVFMEEDLVCSRRDWGIGLLEHLVNRGVFYGFGCPAGAEFAINSLRSLGAWRSS
jgi:hypothetical protein